MWFLYDLIKICYFGSSYPKEYVELIRLIEKYPRGDICLKRVGLSKEWTSSQVFANSLERFGMIYFNKILSLLSVSFQSTQPILYH